ncbi:MAG: hypothetical protein EOP06_06915 [Proteobacteria bacterium]|nr:MAG: hypothetical protein EOP06_06915 [Pseudomonadota bacterium]
MSSKLKNPRSAAKKRKTLPPAAEQHQIVAEVEARTAAIDYLDAELDRQAFLWSHPYINPCSLV